jgi:Asp-tRNA(Asn)/Glu-tRNA(Gln) amidotransferase A subunit family amidase
MHGLDGVVTLPTTGEAPADLTWTGDPTFCTIWSLCGVPAVVIPTGCGPNGMPLGLQITGARSADGQVLAAAGWCDERVGRRQRIVT